MRVPVLILAGLAAVSAAAARHGVEVDRKTYPQATAKETLASALKAIELKRFDYLLAHLSDPDWVDGRVEAYDGGFPELVKETTAKLDPGAVKQLRRLAKEGEFETLDATVLVRHKDVKDRVVRLRKVDGRWFLQSDFKP